MRNFEFEHNGKKYWYSRSMAVLGIVTGLDKDLNPYVLANKRGEGTPDYQGYWCMPCGYLDFDETTENAVTREILEETGLKITAHNSTITLHSIDSIPEERQNVTIRYRIRYREKSIENTRLHTNFSETNEVEDVRWIKIHDIVNYKWAFNHLELLKELFYIK